MLVSPSIEAELPATGQMLFPPKWNCNGFVIFFMEVSVAGCLVSCYKGSGRCGTSVVAQGFNLDTRASQIEGGGLRSEPGGSRAIDASLISAMRGIGSDGQVLGRRRNCRKLRYRLRSLRISPMARG